MHRAGLKVVAPSTAYNAEGLLKAAIRERQSRRLLQAADLYRRAKGPVPEGDEDRPIGVAATRREGTDVTLVTYGAMVVPALEAADRLSKEGVEVEVIDLRTLRRSTRKRYSARSRKRIADDRARGREDARHRRRGCRRS